MKKVILGILLFWSGILFASEKEIDCLAKNIYFEARNEPILGQVAIAMVTMNRVRDLRFPNTVCGVVKQGYRKNRKDCHFSWYCDGKPDTPMEKLAWDVAKIIAAWYYENHMYVEDVTNGANHYHSTKVKPWWTKKMKQTNKIGNHIFYKW